MSSAPLVSIVIPLYNCGKHVEGLISMLFSQTFESFEIIFIDDGSTDNTLEKIRTCCILDRRCIVLAQEHAGAGAARNVGIEKAQGTYLMFLDADDEYRENLLADLVSAAEDLHADEAFCLFDEYNYKTHAHREDLGFSKAVFPHRTLVATADVEDIYRKIPWWCPNTLFRKEIIDRYHLRFSTTRVANDEFFMRAYASVATTMVGLHSHLLTYRRYFDAQSLTSSRGEHTEDMIEVLLDLHDWLREHKLYEQHREAYLSYLIHSIYYDGSFPYRSCYVEAVVDALCNRGLFQHMNERNFYNVYWKRYDTERIRKTIANLRAQGQLNMQEVEAWSNRLATIRGIEKLAKEKYGRTLDPRSVVERKFGASLARIKTYIKQQGE